MIIHSDNFMGYPLSDTKKGASGFYKNILEKIILSLEFAKEKWIRPVALHVVIEDPGSMQRMDKFMKSFINIRQQYGSKLSRYISISVTEIRPRAVMPHLHVLFILDGANYKDIIALEEACQKLSKQRKARVYQRLSSSRPIKYCQQTGEAMMNRSGTDFARLGSNYYHDLRLELADAVKRFSYLAKVFSKSESKYRSSNGEVETIPTPHSVKKHMQATPSEVKAFDGMQLGIDQNV